MPSRSIPQQAIRSSPAIRRSQLEERWRDQLARVTELSLAYHDERQNAARETAGPASRRARLIARQAIAERQALAEIEAALDRLAAGTYGRCEQCGRAIAAALLSALPQARYCAACGQRGRLGQRTAYA